MSKHEIQSVNKFAKFANVTTATVYNWIKTSQKLGLEHIKHNGETYAILVIAEKYCLQKQ